MKNFKWQNSLTSNPSLLNDSMLTLMRWIPQGMSSEKNFLFTGIWLQNTFSNFSRYLSLPPSFPPSLLPSLPLPSLSLSLSLSSLSFSLTSPPLSPPPPLSLSLSLSLHTQRFSPKSFPSLHLVIRHPSSSCWWSCCRQSARSPQCEDSTHSFTTSLCISHTLLCYSDNMLKAGYTPSSIPLWSILTIWALDWGEERSTSTKVWSVLE